MKKLTYISLFAILLFNSCSKPIEFDLPTVEQTLVVEATVESGELPRVIITNSQGYFDPIDTNTFLNMFVTDAEVKLSDGQNVFDLEFNLIFHNGIFLPGYTSSDPNAKGQYGKSYSLNIYHEGDTINASTKIPDPLYLDSLWFDSYSGDYGDTLGFIGALISDPDTVGNCYRWFAKRINSYTYNYESPFDNIKGQPKDSRFLAPIGSSSDDKLFNGLTYEFFFPRGEDGLSSAPDDNDLEQGFYKIGDTIVVKSTTTTYPVYLYVRAMENAAVSNGGIFSSPGNLPYNVEGDGIGVFIGYGATYDTLICE